MSRKNEILRELENNTADMFGYAYTESRNILEDLLKECYSVAIDLLEENGIRDPYLTFKRRLAESLKEWEEWGSEEDESDEE